MRPTALVLVLLAAPFAAANAPLAPPDDCATGVDAPAAPEAAHLVASGDSCNGELRTLFGDTVDWFRFEASAGQVVEIEAQAEGGPGLVQLCLREPGGSAPDSCRQSGDGNLSRRALASAGTWALSVEAYDVRPLAPLGPAFPQPPWTYAFHLTVRDPAPQDDCGAGRDTSASSAHTIPAPGACHGAFVAADLDGIDYYRFNLTGGTVVNASLRGAAGNEVAMCMWGILAHVGHANIACSSQAGDEWIRGAIGAVENESTWYALLWGKDGGYAFDVALDDGPALANADCGSGRDAAADDPVALPLPVDGCAGVFPPFSGDRDDVYTFLLDAGDRLTATARPNPRAWIEIRIYDAEGDLRGRAGAHGRNATAVVDADVAGAWRAVVRSDYPLDDYRLWLESRRTLVPAPLTYLEP